MRRTHTHTDTLTRTEALTTETLTNTQRQKFSDEKLLRTFCPLGYTSFPTQ